MHYSETQLSIPSWYNMAQNYAGSLTMAGLVWSFATSKNTVTNLAAKLLPPAEAIIPEPKIDGTTVILIPGLVKALLFAAPVCAMQTHPKKKQKAIRTKLVPNQTHKDELLAKQNLLRKQLKQKEKRPTNKLGTMSHRHSTA